MPLTFRFAEPGDIPLLGVLAAQIWRQSYAEMISAEQIEYMLGWMYASEKLAAELASGAVWELALLDGVPIGYLALSCEPTHMELHKLYLLPEHQGRGHGQTMLARAAAIAASHGSPEIRLRVNKGNTRALRAYERAGFRIVDSLVADIGGGFFMDDYVMVRELPLKSARREKSF